MLEVKNLYREYKPKKGTPVKALDDVSLKFPDKGLVFILGKSGSGKSTLLNVMGGLDKADGGDIIIKGKSSKDFKQGDFDSYRNTYLGFIFQEYNILDEFNVGQNIALAIELQGRKATTEEINAILKEVDLQGYGQRKINELSGGQKQRVAIARALIKNPEIIFGDEPTGALDSKTGIQVFDTLKKLAENKLIIVVSHDREFAEMYGDRVIELADGKVISDISKVKVAGDKKNSGLTVIDEKLIKIEKDYELTDDDMQIIKEYLNKNRNEKLLSFDDSLNAGIKHVARIDDFGNKESFNQTNNDEIINKHEEYKIIKSRLSIKRCLKIGSSSLKHKPFRLVLTILLSVVSFTLFGLADTMASYNGVVAAYNTMKDTNTNTISIAKEVAYKYSDNDYAYFNQASMGDTDLTSLNSAYNNAFKPVYKLELNSYSYSGVNVNNFSDDNNRSYLYPTGVSGAMVLSQAEIEELGFTIKGSYPSHLNEVAISDVLFKTFQQYGYRNYDDVSDIIKANEVTMERIIGKTISFGSLRNIKITGIIDTGFDYSMYPDDSKNKDNTFTSYMIQERFRNDYLYSYASALFITQEMADYIVENCIKEIYFNCYPFDADSFDAYKTSGVIYEEGKTAPSNDELVISYGTLYRALSYGTCYVSLNSFTYDSIEFYDLRDLIDYMASNNDTAGIKALINERKDEIFANIGDLMVYDLTVNGTLKISNRTFNVVGIDLNDMDMDSRVFYFTQANIDNWRGNDELLCYDHAIALTNSLSRDDTYKILKETFNRDVEDGEYAYHANNGIMPMYTNFNETINQLSQVFLIVGIVFAVFAGLMLFNFISVSISYKKREIGILRAVGARAKDVFGIFMSESGIIALIAYVCSMIATFIISVMINKSLVKDYNIMLTLFNLGIRQILLVFAVTLGVAFVSTLLPVYRIAMKRPIDAIRDI